MAYGYKQWAKLEGVGDDGAPKDPRIGALEKALDIIENLKFPRPGWGMIDPEDFEYRLKAMLSQDSDGNKSWDGGINEVLEMLSQAPSIRYCGDKFDPKDLINEIKKAIKAAG